jgi:hypothetical protein
MVTICVIQIKFLAMNEDYTRGSREESAPDLRYYKTQLTVLADLAEKASQLRFAFFQHILLVSASVLGILISLHENSSPCIYIRLVFLLSLVLFGLGILSTGIVVMITRFLGKSFKSATRRNLNKH